MAQQLAHWIPPFTAPPHQIYVKRLYRRSLRLCSDWFWEKLEYREKSHMVRDLFEAKRNETNPIEIQAALKEAEFLLSKYYHPFPKKNPNAPGGSKWERNTPVPDEVIKMGPVSHHGFFTK